MKFCVNCVAGSCIGKSLVSIGMACRPLPASQDCIISAMSQCHTRLLQARVHVVQKAEAGIAKQTQMCGPSPFAAAWPLMAPRPGRDGLCARSAVGTGTKRTECAPPRANARLSNTCNLCTQPSSGPFENFCCAMPICPANVRSSMI